MSCDIYSKLWIKDEYVLGKLSDTEKEAFEKHFFECDSCFQELKLQQEMVQLIKEEGSVLFAEYLRAEQKQAKDTVPESAKTFSFPRFKIQFKPFYATAAILLIMIGSFYAAKNFFQKDLLASIEFDDQVPYKFVHESGFRSGDQKTTGAVISFFNNQFSIGISDYTALNYIGAIEILKPLESELEKLQQVMDAEKFASAKNDYHFFLGVSYLAAAQSKKYVLADSIKNIYLQYAIQQLVNSKKTGHIHDNRVSYFLGMSYILAGSKQKAISELQEIEKTSDFYKNGEELSKSIRKQ